MNPKIVIKAFDGAGRPVVEGARLAALPLRHIVLLAVPRRIVAVLSEDFADGYGFPRNDAVVSREAGRLIHDDARGDRVVVAAGEQGGPRRRAERRGVEPRVGQTHFGDLVQRRRRDHPAEGGRGREALVVDHDQKNVWRACGRHSQRRPPLGGLGGVEVGDAAERRRGRRQSVAHGRPPSRRRARNGLDMSAAWNRCGRHRLGFCFCRSPPAEDSQ